MSLFNINKRNTHGQLIFWYQAIFEPMFVIETSKQNTDYVRKSLYLY